MAEGANAFQKLLDLCQDKLAPDDLAIIARAKDVLVKKELVTPGAVEPFTAAQLVDFGLAPGLASVLKKAFPGAGALRPVGRGFRLPRLLLWLWIKGSH